MVEIGRRSARGDAWADQGRLARTAALLRGGRGLVNDSQRHVVVRVADEVVVDLMVAPAG